MGAAEQQINNAYDETIKALKLKRQQTQNQYNNLYNDLDNQWNEDYEGFEDDRKNASLDSAKKAQQIRDWLANRNLSTSGESVDAMLRNNTDYNNNLGKIYSTQKKAKLAVDNQRNKYKGEEQLAYSDLSNQETSAARDRATRLASLYEQQRAAAAAASRAASRAAAKKNSSAKTDNMAQAMDYLNKWASGQALNDDGTVKGRATADEIYQWINDKAADLTRTGVNVNSLTTWAKNTFKWNPAEDSILDPTTNTWVTKPSETDSSSSSSTPKKHWWEFWK